MKPCGIFPSSLKFIPVAVNRLSFPMDIAPFLLNPRYKSSQQHDFDDLYKDYTIGPVFQKPTLYH